MPSKKRVLITGGAGFIGSHTVDNFLKKGFKVRVIDNLVGGNLKNIEHLKNNRDFQFEKKDILNLDKIKKFVNDCEYVVHFAGIGDIVPSIKYPKKYFENNVLGTVKVLDCLNPSKIKKFVYAASSSCYGKAKTPTDENHLIDPLYPYALSKYQGEQVALHWHKVYKFPINSIRIFNAYGTRSRTTGAYGAVFGVFLKQLIAKKPLTVVGDGSQKRDFLYVSDVAEAFYLAAVTKKTGCIWNLGSGEPQSVKKLVKLLKPEKIIYIPKRPGDADHSAADIKKIKKNLKWKPKISLKNGLLMLLKTLKINRIK